jgi:hypothetical protein
LEEVPFVKERLVAKRLVEVEFVPVAFVKVKPCREVLPTTVKVDVTVEEAATKPPYKPSVFVVVAPFVVTDCKVLNGQFKPLTRQTLEPLTAIAVALSVVPLAVAKPNQLVDVPFVTIELVMFELTVAKFVAKRFVLVVLVPVAFVQVRLAKLEGVAPVTVKFAMVAFVA